MTTLNQNFSWFVGIFFFVALFTGSSLLFTGDAEQQRQVIPFSDLSDNDVDYILSVKAQMQAVNTHADF